MESISSVSKGVFIFKNGPDLKKLRKQKNFQLSNENNATNAAYLQYKVQLGLVEAQIEQIKSSSNEKILKNLLDFIANIDIRLNKNLQTAILLTGVNQTDHLRQFEVLSQQITNNIHSITTILESRNCPTVKSAVESIVSGIIRQVEPNLKFKRRQLTLQVLRAWYKQSYSRMASYDKPKLIIMLNDFEQFDTSCVKDLITILTISAAHIPLVLVIGVATAYKTLQNVLPSHVLNRMDTNVFQSKSSTEMLNQILDKVVLNPKASFHLSGRSFKILMDIFLFYDYSLHSFLQGYKIFMLEHFLTRPLNCRFESSKKLQHEELESIRRVCFSFRKLVETQKNPRDRIDLINSDKMLAGALQGLMKENEEFWHEFHLSLRILVILFDDLPKNDLGKLLRELYPICIAEDITKLDEFKECFGLLKFTSKDKFLAKISKILKLVKRSEFSDLSAATELVDSLNHHSVEIEQAGKVAKTPSSTPTSSPSLNHAVTKSRKDMMAMLKQNAANNPQRVIMEYEQKLYSCLDFLATFLSQKLKSIHQAPPLHELFIFTEAHLVRRQIVGAPRGSIHNALTNPHHYLQCKCCEVQENEQIIPTLPDLAIAYKLHLECNKNINLYDWLQAFAMVIEANEDGISAEIQARFTRSVAELQFLGLIKQAKHKADHVVRLTW